MHFKCLCRHFLRIPTVCMRTHLLIHITPEKLCFKRSPLRDWGLPLRRRIVTHSSPVWDIKWAQGQNELSHKRQKKTVFRFPLINKPNSLFLVFIFIHLSAPFSPYNLSSKSQADCYGYNISLVFSTVHTPTLYYSGSLTANDLGGEIIKAWFLSTKL